MWFPFISCTLKLDPTGLNCFQLVLTNFNYLGRAWNVTLLERKVPFWCNFFVLFLLPATFLSLYQTDRSDVFWPSYIYISWCAIMIQTDIWGAKSVAAVVDRIMTCYLVTSILEYVSIQMTFMIVKLYWSTLSSTKNLDDEGPMISYIHYSGREPWFCNLDRYSLFGRIPFGVKIKVHNVFYTHTSIYSKLMLITDGSKYR